MLTAQEKAKELVDKYKSFDVNVRYVDLEGDVDGAVGAMSHYSAKQCALTAVGQIEDFMKMDDEYNKDCHMANTHWVRYWKRVKEEIEKLQ